jgi:NAD(P)-dependent dehydrogenase (short-subunit alcohol dehydrogenase family)
VTFRIDAAGSRAFARLSGDANPLHLDPVAARRSVYGRCVIHGVHLLLRGLAARPGPRRSLRELRLRFLRPGFEGAPISVEYAPKGAATELRLQGEDGTPLVAASLAEEPAAADDSPVPEGLHEPGAPVALEVADAIGFRHEEPLAFDRALAAEVLPGIVERYRAVQLAELLAVTRVVGMRCPGLYSTLTGLHLRAAHGRSAATSSFRAVNVHADTGRVRLAIEGPTLTGEVEAFFRPREVEQPSFADTKASVIPGEFAGRRALVVGGSRGLGELAAKILAAGGAEVIVTYRVGAADAERVAAEIRGGGGVCEALRLDVQAAPDAWRAPRGFAPTDLLYFATPHIGAPGGTFDARRFAEFCSVYVDGFVAAVTFAARLSAGRLAVFHPSTVFLDAGEGAAEYVAAKAASEAVARWLGRRPGVRMHSVRLPALATDETSAFMVKARPPALPTLLAALRSQGAA